MIKQNVSLKDFSNYKIGGKAAYFLEVKTKEELTQGLRGWREIAKDFPQGRKRVFVFGSGTNILFPDEGLDFLVIKNSIDGISLLGNTVTVGSGTLFSNLLLFCVEHSLSGLEWAGGMPGTVGGAVRGNAGAFGGETKDNILEVVSVNLETLAEVKRARQECHFSYRSSIFKQEAKNEIIVSAEFSLIKGEQIKINQQIVKEEEFRKARHPLEYPNVGSVFKNVPFENVSEQYKEELSEYVKNDPFPVVPTAKIIFLAGLKGERVGGVAVSDKHTNFIVNLGNGKASDVKKLIEIIKSAVRKKFNIELEEEIIEVN
jgi:UDP-N-acetylmuramate dehydrogenase